MKKLVIIESPGAVIEMKRKKGGVVSDDQQFWLNALSIRGWQVAVCRGIDEAIEQLKYWGYIN
jgi:hypothetical protein